MLVYVRFLSRPNLRHSISCASVLSRLKVCAAARFMLLMVKKKKVKDYKLLWCLDVHSVFCETPVDSESV